MEQLLLETKQSYYEYVAKIESGCLQIAIDLRIGNNEQAYQNIISLTEGFGWLLDVEAHMQQNNYQVNSRINDALEMLTDASDALEAGDLITVADLFEYEIAPLFGSATEWVFTEIKK